MCVSEKWLQIRARDKTTLHRITVCGDQHQAIVGLGVKVLFFRPPQGEESGLENVPELLPPQRRMHESRFRICLQSGQTRMSAVLTANDF